MPQNTGYFMPDGRDIGTVFKAGNTGGSTGILLYEGVDVSTYFAPKVYVTTTPSTRIYGSNGRDLVNVFESNDPPVTVEVTLSTNTANAVLTTYYVPDGYDSASKREGYMVNLSGSALCIKQLRDDWLTDGYRNSFVISDSLPDYTGGDLVVRLYRNGSVAWSITVPAAGEWEMGSRTFNDGRHWFRKDDGNLNRYAAAPNFPFSSGSYYATVSYTGYKRV